MDINALLFYVDNLKRQLGRNVLATLQNPVEHFQNSLARYAQENLPSRVDVQDAQSVMPGMDATMREKILNLATGGMGMAGSTAARNAMPGSLPQFATRYPTSGVPSLEIDKTSGKLFAGKQFTPEELQVKGLRDQAQREIESGNWNPYFDVSRREMVDPARYPIKGTTMEEAVPQMWPTYDQYYMRYNTPEVRQRLLDAYDKAVDDPNAGMWYAVKQLEKSFVDELGDKEGRQAFKERFADAMAATTAGTNPTNNLLNAAYANYLRTHGEPFPRARDMSVNTFEAPHPAGGRYYAKGAETYDRVLNQGLGLVAEDQPKMHNFSANFQGHANAGTIDEQMMQLFHPGMNAPAKGSYGALEAILSEMAQLRGVTPAEFQAIAWAGVKGTKGKPMMEHINEMLHRTSKVTGKSQEEVLRGYIRGNMPMYGMGGAAIGAGLLSGGEGGSRDREGY